MGNTVCTNELKYKNNNKKSSSLKLNKRFKKRKITRRNITSEILNSPTKQEESLCDNSIIDIRKLNTKFGIIEAEELNQAINNNKINVMSTIIPQNLNNFKIVVRNLIFPGENLNSVYNINYINELNHMEGF